ncbi:ROK family protein [Erythrobacter litoralis]|uniref:ROK family protein n=1 Tax=Erythrobacter litoralis TaxID=39960 RepID=UPI002435E7DA|nr:ROK family protein [Erythrobacter litoralis]
MAKNGRLAAIEAGGTKFVLAIGDYNGAVIARHVIPTVDPGATLSAAAEWFSNHGPFDALGIASFGPVELDPKHANYGCITTTPKPGWQNCDLVGYFARRFNMPIGFDTDVNAAALAEVHARDESVQPSLAYVTVGTGIGGGLVVDGKTVHGIAHPEMGHYFPRRSDHDDFGGVCPLHSDCLEGLASGPAIEARWGASLSNLPDDHQGKAIIADYLAQLGHTVFAVTAAEIVVLGGGVMQTPGLLERIRLRATELAAGYLPGGERHRIEAPKLGSDSGIVGAFRLAYDALDAV